MRLFLAIQLSPAVREALLTAQDALRRQGRGSFPPPENLHLTLAFLGEVPETRLGVVQEAMEGTHWRKVEF